jgi:thymidylate synthase (FAD)
LKVIDPSYAIVYRPTREEAIKRIADCARTCYQSSGDNDERLVRALVKNGHHAMLEHVFMTVRLVTDRGVSHELVRHRIASYAQESTRYCNYSKGKFGSEITFIRPLLQGVAYDLWEDACQYAEEMYLTLVWDGTPPEIARSILPQSLKTEIVVTANLREWINIFNLRVLGAAGKPHPDMVRLLKPLYDDCKEWLPEVFGYD